MTSAINKDIVLGASLVLSVVSLVLLFGVTWYFQSSLDLLQQQVEYDRELLFKLQEQINVSMIVCSCIYVAMYVHTLYAFSYVCLYTYVHAHTYMYVI